MYDINIVIVILFMALVAGVFVGIIAEKLGKRFRDNTKKIKCRDKIQALMKCQWSKTYLIGSLQPEIDHCILNGFGEEMPESLYQGLRATAASVVVDHLMERYAKVEKACLKAKVRRSARAELVAEEERKKQIEGIQRVLDGINHVKVVIQPNVPAEHIEFTLAREEPQKSSLHTEVNGIDRTLYTPTPKPPDTTEIIVFPVVSAGYLRYRAHYLKGFPTRSHLGSTVEQATDDLVRIGKGTFNAKIDRAIYFRLLDQPSTDGLYGWTCQTQCSHCGRVQKSKRSEVVEGLSCWHCGTPMWSLVKLETAPLEVL